MVSYEVFDGRCVVFGRRGRDLGGAEGLVALKVVN